MDALENIIKEAVQERLHIMWVHIWNFQQGKYGETESRYVVMWQVLYSYMDEYISCASELYKIGDIYYKENWIINKETWFVNQELDAGFPSCTLLDV